MLFVFLSHFALVYIWRSGEIRLATLMYDVAMIASPTFMLISGIMLGYLYRTHPSDFARIRVNYIYRGLFLLTVGRLIIFGSHIVYAGGVKEALLWGFATDAIGVSIIVGPMIVGRLTGGQRALASVCMYVGSWLLILFWLPESWTSNIIKEFLVGPAGRESTRLLTDSFPLLPWMSMHILGSCFGERLGAYYLEGDQAAARSLVLKVGLTGCMGGALVAALRFAIPFNGLTDPEWTRHLLLSPFGKLPPSPAYTLLYGGIGVLILYLLLRFEEFPPVTLYVKFTEVLGQTSLFVFMFQYYIYFTFFMLLDLQFTVLWPLYFIASVALIAIVAQFWKRRDYNRFLDIRYPGVIRRLMSAAW